MSFLRCQEEEGSYREGICGGGEVGERGLFVGGHSGSWLAAPQAGHLSNRGYSCGSCRRKWCKNMGKCLRCVDKKRRLQNRT